MDMGILARAYKGLRVECALGQAHLEDPYLTLHAAQAHGLSPDRWPAPYRLQS